MAVDIVVKAAPAMVLATRTLKGKWPGDRALQSEFEKVEAWAKSKKRRTGPWVFREFGMNGPEAEMRWEVGIAVSGAARGGGGVSMKRLPATKVASVTFDPDAVSPRLVYHGLMGWLHAMKKEGKHRPNGPYREVYPGNPWRKPSAWSRTQVQVPIRGS